MPKRKLDCCETEDGEAPVESEDSNSSVHTNSSTDVPNSEVYTQLRKKPKKSVSFKNVTVFYFPRKQGFTCVPSQGGSTLGMADKHATVESFTISEYIQRQRRTHRVMLQEQQKLGKLPTSIPMKPITDKTCSSESSDSEDDYSDYCFLQPVATRQRRLLLRQAGIKKIEGVEKEECKDIRISREVCGCDCRVYCDPKTCACSLANIKCQVDRLSFPCACSRDGCGNKAGRIEFNPIRVRTHFIHTLMRLELEKKRQESEKVLKKSLSESQCKNQPNGDTNGEPRLEQEDLSFYNSTELGSCRDCQNTEVNDVMMREVQLSQMEAASQFAPHRFVKDLQHDQSPTQCPQSMPPRNDPQRKDIMYSDSDEEFPADGTNEMFGYKQEEGSYSESSECSSVSSVDEGSMTLSSSENSQVNGASTKGASPDQQFTELNNASSAAYKLEPISEMLNPIRFNGYPVDQISSGMPQYHPPYTSTLGSESHNENNRSAIYNTSLPHGGQPLSYPAYTAADPQPTPNSTYTGDLNQNGAMSATLYSDDYGPGFNDETFTGCLGFSLPCLNKTSPHGSEELSADGSNHVHSSTTYNRVPQDQMYYGPAAGPPTHEPGAQTSPLHTNSADEEVVNGRGDATVTSSSDVTSNTAELHTSLDEGEKNFTDLSHSRPSGSSPHIHGHCRAVNELEERMPDKLLSTSENFVTNGNVKFDSEVGKQVLDGIAAEDMSSLLPFDTPGCDEGSPDEGHDLPTSSCESPQNFGEIIKKSIVETVSA